MQELSNNYNYCLIPATKNDKNYIFLYFLQPKFAKITIFIFSATKIKQQLHFFVISTVWFLLPPACECVTRFQHSYPNQTIISIFGVELHSPPPLESQAYISPFVHHGPFVQQTRYHTPFGCRCFPRDMVIARTARQPRCFGIVGSGVGVCLLVCAYVCDV